MYLTDVPAHIVRERDLPITLEELRDEYGQLTIEPPNGEPESLMKLLDRCATHAGDGPYRTADELRETLLCYADERHVGRRYYDDRGGNPTDDSGPAL